MCTPIKLALDVGQAGRGEANATILERATESRAGLGEGKRPTNDRDVSSWSVERWRESCVCVRDKNMTWMD